MRILLVNESSFLETGYAKYGRNILERLHKDGYEVAELGIFSTDEEQRISKVKWKFFPNGPGDPNYGKDSSDVYGKFAFEKAVCEFKPHIVCFKANELVLTDCGYKEISNISIGDMVYTHKGRWKKVVKVMKTEYIGDMTSVKFNGFYKSIHSTPEHPYLVYKNKKRTFQKPTYNKMFDKENPDFIEANSLKPKDLQTFTLPTEEKIKNIKISDYISSYIRDGDFIYIKNGKKIYEKVSTDYNLGLFLGYFLGDGSLNDSGISVTFNLKEEHFVEEFQKCVTELFQLEKSNLFFYKDRKAITVSINSVIISEFLEKTIGKNKNKFEFLDGLNLNFAKGLVRGLVRSDGCYKKQTISFTNTNIKIAYLYRFLCMSLGFPSTIISRKNSGNLSSYDVNIHGKNAIKFHEIVKKHENHYVKNTSNSCQVFKINNHICSSISRIRKLKYSGCVYNLEVEEDNSYLVNQTNVHNCDLRDPFMYDFEYYSPLRDKYHWMIMAPVDGLPQQPQWLDIFKNADNVFTYTDWAKELLKEYNINAITASPASSSCCHPLSRNEVSELKKKFNLTNKKIVGTVMRNQPRKLFESLFAGFRQYLNISKDNDTLLYLHTSYPDVGYNLIKLTFEYQLASKVIITYICKHCKHYQPMFLSDIATFCPKCRNKSFKITDVYTSLKESEMNEVYNLFDVYVQCASREGFGMPQVEAASCGIPIVSMPYAGMNDICNKISSHKIAIAGEKMNHSMHMYEAVPSINSIAKSIDNAMGSKYNNNVRKEFEKHYSSWDTTYQIWKNEIDKVNVDEIERRQREKYVIDNNFSVNQNLPNVEFAKELVNNFAGKRFLGSYLHTRLIQDLNLGVAFGDLGYYIVNHFDHFHANNFNKEVAIQVFAKIAERNLYWRKYWNDRSN